ncbi:EscU/YscU/HrcU family type III secretion system export apparatus switch protein [Providencia rettgeri]|uniref:EscU/YscU/HrcU family type III secretion system export apparatus switch protein n=1 Tax=Providencia rettgeri TaxID=587 RepID=UPI0034E06D85
MSEKTEKPTSKKIRDSRKKGQVAKSNEITSGMQLVVLLSYFSFEGPELWNAFKLMIDTNISFINYNEHFAIGQWLNAFSSILLRFMGGLALVVIFTSIFSIMSQIGPLLATEALTPSFKKLNVISNFKHIFSMQNLFEFVKSIFKTVSLSVIFYLLIKNNSYSIQFLPLNPIGNGVLICIHLLYIMILSLIGFYVVFGIADFAFQRYNNTKKLMMSLDEIKKEYKNSEGNPQLKSKRKAIHREIQSGSLSKNVAKSTVVVKNPTHVAVCLYYKSNETPLPKVIEVGFNKRALHIIQLAEKSGIPIVENIDVARSLAKKTAVGSYIPPTLFEPVANILRTVMNLNYEKESIRDEN